jgi:prephenate dehydrogenase
MDDIHDFISQPHQLSQARVAILGLGLMGGSLAMALHGRCAALLGVDPHETTLALALERGIVDQAALDPREILPQADLVILAAPVEAILQLLADLPQLHPGPAVVMDLGSTKARIVEAMQGLPRRFDPLGGHPMCGKEKTSLQNAEAELFQGASFALTPLERSSPWARSMAAQVVSAIGAHPVWLDSATHDHWTARTSHFPYLAACLLASITPISAAPLVGPGFRSTTRVAATSPAVMLDILMTNRDELLAALVDFRSELDRLEAYLSQAAADDLRQMLLAGGERRRELLTEGENGAGG